MFAFWGSTRKRQLTQTFRLVPTTAARLANQLTAKRPQHHLPDSLQKLISDSDLLMLSHLSHSNSNNNPPGYSRQESRDSLIEVALDNTEQIVAKLLGKNSRVILNNNSRQLPTAQPPLLDL
jgi:hypothetical protein